MISSLLYDPISTLMFLLLAMPGRLLAISCHEWAHAWMAYRCGDPTAKNMGRMTINPKAHLDFIGLLMMLLAGFGWAKPVPVNPNNYRHYRRDDLKVSLAGITMNLILFIFGMVVIYGIIALALIKASGNTYADPYFIWTHLGQKCLIVVENGSAEYLPISYILSNTSGYGGYLMGSVFNQIAVYLYDMLTYFTVTNLVLAIFNLIPVPPLDGYHVLDDIVLHRLHIRIPYQAKQWLMLIMLVLIFSGGSTWIISNVQDLVFRGIGSLAETAFTAMGII